MGGGIRSLPAAEYARSRGKDCLRLDYDHAKPYLDRLYRSRGFVPVDRVTAGNGRTYTRSESRLR
jgi:hypothetical protein